LHLTAAPVARWAAGVTAAQLQVNLADRHPLPKLMPFILPFWADSESGFHVSHIAQNPLIAH
jgi:hypothetical protein